MAGVKSYLVGLVVISGVTEYKALAELSARANLEITYLINFPGWWLFLLICLYQLLTNKKYLSRVYLLPPFRRFAKSLMVVFIMFIILGSQISSKHIAMTLNLFVWVEIAFVLAWLFIFWMALMTSRKLLADGFQEQA